MAIPVKATCSECLTMFWIDLRLDQSQLTCPNCQHTMANLPEGELNELNSTVRKQKLSAIIALAAFALAAVLILAWAFQSPEPRIEDNFLMDQGLPIFAGLLSLGALVFGALASRVRYIIEF
jgi:hypothetical protein